MCREEAPGVLLLGQTLRWTAAQASASNSGALLDGGGHPAAVEGEVDSAAAKGDGSFCGGREKGGKARADVGWRSKARSVTAAERQEKQNTSCILLDILLLADLFLEVHAGAGSAERLPSLGASGSHPSFFPRMQWSTTRLLSFFEAWLSGSRRRNSTAASSVRPIDSSGLPRNLQSHAPSGSRDSSTKPP
jgi:hypothetical protein